MNETLVNMIFLFATGMIAWHGIRYRDSNGQSDFVRTLFGCIAATYFFLVLMKDILQIELF